MDIGALLVPEADGRVVVERARLAVDLGFGRLGMGDVPGRDGELYVTLGQLAAAGLDVPIGPMVTNPASRHLDVTAAAVAAVARLNPGGAYLGLGRGGSPLRGMGLPRPRTAELAAAATTLRETLGRHGVDAPVLVSAYGPQTLQQGGASGDGVIIAGGASVDYVREAIETARAGAQAAGRDPASLQITVMSRISVADTREEAVRAVRGNLASAGANNLRAPSELAALPEDVRERLAELRRRYDVRPEAHVSDGSPNADLIDELGLTDFLADRYAVAGTPDQVRARFVELETLGVDVVWAPAVEADPDAFLRRLATALPTA